MCFVFSIFICSGGKNAPSWVVVRRYAPWKSKSASGLWFATWGCSQVAQGLSVKRTGSLGGCVLELQFFSYLIQCKLRKVIGLSMARLKIFMGILKAQPERLSLLPTYVIEYWMLTALVLLLKAHGIAAAA